MGTVNEWYTEHEVYQWLKTEKPFLLAESKWITAHLNSAFQKGRQIGRGEILQEQGGRDAVLVMPERLREWRRKSGLSLVPVAERLNCTIVEASAMERGKPVRSELVDAAESLLANIKQK